MPLGRLAYRLGSAAVSRRADALAAIDAANADDPNTIEVRGEVRPKEQAHAELMTEWLERLDPEATDAQHLAARAHHLRRWSRPRSDYPEGRAGYLRWRTALKKQHAEEVASILQGSATTWRRSLGHSASSARRDLAPTRRSRRTRTRSASCSSRRSSPSCRRPRRREDGRDHQEDSRQDEPTSAPARRRPADARRRPGPDQSSPGTGPGLNDGLGSPEHPLLSSLAHADVAQLVEHNLAKVGVAGSNPVVRSKKRRSRRDGWPRAGNGSSRE